jgi:polyferredoxin
VNWFPILLTAHVILAVSLLAPSLVLPFLLRRQAEGGEPSTVIRLLATLQGTGSLVIAAALALTGAGLVISLGTEILSKPWLLVALTVYALNLLVAAFISRPSLRRLMRVREPDSEGWRQQARRVRYVAYGMAVATGLIGFLMSTKPALW